MRRAEIKVSRRSATAERSGDTMGGANGRDGSDGAVAPLCCSGGVGCDEDDGVDSF